MTSKERVKAAINWECPDRIPFHESFWTDTLTAWKTQGLPEKVTMYPPNSVEKYFGMDIVPLYLDSSPRFEQKIISRDGSYYTYEDRWGYTATKPWQASGSIHYTSTKTVDRKCWENQVKPGMCLREGDNARIDDASYFEHFDSYPTWDEAKRKADSIVQAQKYALTFNYGPWEATWRHHDFAACLMDVALEPEWMLEMAWVHHELTKKIIATCIDKGIRMDGYIMVDDLGSGTAPLISPDMFVKMYKPIYKDMADFLASYGIDFWLHSCGCVNLLIDEYIDSGVRVLNPVQVSAGMNGVEIAEKYGGKIAFYGGIDAHLFTKPYSEAERSLESLCRTFRRGGWVCHSDHSVPPEMKFEDFVKMKNFVKNYPLERSL